MKTLKTLVLAKSLAVAAVMATSGALPVAAHAAESTGVTCPSDSQASLSSSNVLTCKKHKELASICSPLAFTQSGKAIVNSNITMVSSGPGAGPNGRDMCLATVTGVAVPSVMQPPTPGIDPPASAFHLVVNASGPDKFVADFFVYPTAGPLGDPFYSGDASHGVKCPSGYHGVGISNDRGLRCEAQVAKKAVCDIGWSASRRSGRDLCTSHDIFGNEVIGQYTIPDNAGYIGLMGNPETHGWNLDKDHDGNIDYWLSETKSFKYAVTF